MSKINTKKHRVIEAGTNVEFIYLPVDLEEMQGLSKRHRDKYPNEPVSGWVSATELLNLIGNNDANGVRIYFGRQEATKEWPDGMLTVFLVATKTEKNPPTCETSEDVVDPQASANGTVFFVGLGDDRIPLCPPKCSIESIITKGI